MSERCTSSTAAPDLRPSPLKVPVSALDAGGTRLTVGMASADAHTVDLAETLPPKLTTVAVARFEDLLARGLCGLIDSEASLELVAHDVEHERLGVVLRAHRPQVAILDVDALSNLAEVRELSLGHPDTRLVLLATHPTTTECAQLLAFGASACLGRRAQARDVLTAVHLASRGLQLAPRASLESGDAPSHVLQLLTRREAEVLPMLQRGSSNGQIALTLQVGVETVRTHASNIYRKLGVSSRRELAALPPHAPTQLTSPRGTADTDAQSADAPTLHPERRRTGRARDRQRRSGSLHR
jgi:DNA-binding NarL/FixJ family response regulator